MHIKSFAAGFLLAVLVLAGITWVARPASVSADTSEDRVRWCEEMSGGGGLSPGAIEVRHTLAIMASNMYTGSQNQWYSQNYESARNSACQLLWVIYHPNEGR